MVREINDSILGALSQWSDGSWSVNYFSTAFDTNLDIQIETIDFGKSELPSENQYRVFSWFNSNQSEIKNAIESTIYKKYQNNLSEIRVALGGEADNRAPILTSSSQIWSLLGLPTICILSDAVDIVFEFSTHWDAEHNISILFKNGVVVLID